MNKINDKVRLDNRKERNREEFNKNRIKIFYKNRSPQNSMPFSQPLEQQFSEYTPAIYFTQQTLYQGQRLYQNQFYNNNFDENFNHVTQEEETFPYKPEIQSTNSIIVPNRFVHNNSPLKWQYLEQKLQRENDNFLNYPESNFTVTNNNNTIPSPNFNFSIHRDRAENIFEEFQNDQLNTK